MAGMVDPAANFIWRSVSTTVTAQGIEEKAPQNESEWTELRNAANLLSRGGRLLKQDPQREGDEDWLKLAIYFTQVTPTCCGPGLRQTRGAIGVQWSSETRRPRCIQRPPEGRPSSSAGVSSVVGAGPWPGCERAGAGLDGDRNILGLPE